MKNSLFVLFTVALLPACALAVDGVVLINQASLNAAGGTYPITSAGSYKLSGNLQAKDKDTSVILISVDNVTIDLNGFSILGPRDCTSGFPCTNSGSGIGITTHVGLGTGTALYNITVRNGTIQGMGNSAIQLFGDSFLVEYMHVRSNGYGIFARGPGSSKNCILRHNNISQNDNGGIVASGGLITDNSVTQNNGAGISLDSDGTVARNSIADNIRVGIVFAGAGNYYQNVLSGNNSGGLQVLGGGVNQGQNLCNGSSCPAPVL